MSKRRSEEALESPRKRQEQEGLSSLLGGYHSSDESDQGMPEAEPEPHTGDDREAGTGRFNEEDVQESTDMAENDPGALGLGLQNQPEDYIHTDPAGNPSSPESHIQGTVSGAETTPQWEAPADNAASRLPLEILEPPPGECDTSSQAKVVNFITVQQTRGISLVHKLKEDKAYRNPDFMAKMVEHFNISQYGSCFAKEIFDPDALPDEDTLEQLEKRMNQESARARTKRAETGRVEFRSGGTQAPTTQSMDAARLAAQAKAAELSKVVSRWDKHELSMPARFTLKEKWSYWSKESTNATKGVA